jgi:hypothetical protein
MDSFREFGGEVSVSRHPLRWKFDPEVLASAVIRLGMGCSTYQSEHIGHTTFPLASNLNISFSPTPSATCIILIGHSEVRISELATYDTRLMKPSHNI